MCPRADLLSSVFRQFSPVVCLDFVRVIVTGEGLVVDEWFSAEMCGNFVFFFRFLVIVLVSTCVELTAFGWRLVFGREKKRENHRIY